MYLAILITCSILSAILAALLLFFARSLVFMFSIFQGPVYVPSSDEDMQTMLKMAQLKKGTRVIDLGSGNGKIVLAAAQAGAIATGVEINPFLVRAARKNIQEAGMQKTAKILQQSFWKTGLSKYDVIFLYGTTYIMKKLEVKLRTEMKPGAVFISNYFQLPQLQPKQALGKIRKYQVR